MVWYVKLDWHSECYNTNWVEHFSTYEQAYNRQREVLKDEYKLHFNRYPNKKLKNEEIDDKIQEKIQLRKDEEDHFDQTDYSFECEIKEVKL